MTHPNFSPAAANRILQENAPLAQMVDAAIWDARIPESYSEEAGQWASYLHVSGWMEEAKEQVALTFGGELWKSQKQIVKEKTREAVAKLREDEIAPRGVVGWFILQFVAFPFLGRLIQSLLFGED